MIEKEKIMDNLKAQYKTAVKNMDNSADKTEWSYWHGVATGLEIAITASSSTMNHIH
jgi:hypothetical protein